MEPFSYLCNQYLYTYISNGGMVDGNFHIYDGTSFLPQPVPDSAGIASFHELNGNVYSPFQNKVYKFQCGSTISLNEQLGLLVAWQAVPNRLQK